MSAGEEQKKEEKEEVEEEEEEKELEEEEEDEDEAEEEEEEEETEMFDYQESGIFIQRYQQLSQEDTDVPEVNDDNYIYLDEMLTETNSRNTSRTAYRVQTVHTTPTLLNQNR